MSAINLTDMRDDEETATGRAIRLVQNQSIEECAATAEAVGKRLGEPAMGHAIAKAILMLRRL